MNKIYLVSFVILFTFSACVNIKSELPQVNYYDLDNSVDINKQCSDKAINIGLLDIPSSPASVNLNINFRESSGEIIAYKNSMWVDMPKNMYKKIIFKALESKCKQVSTQPFGVVRLEYLLKVSILNLDVTKRNSQDLGIISIAYELIDTKTFLVVKRGLITKEEPIKNGNYVISLQNVAFNSAKELTERLF